MTPRYGIDTSILVRLLTGRPGDTYVACRNTLQRLIEDRGVRIFASNMRLPATELLLPQRTP